MKPKFCLFSCWIAVLCLTWMGCSPPAPRTPLDQAAEKNDLKLVQIHIAAKTDLNKLNSAGWSALHIAAMKGNLTIVKALSEAGADIKCASKNGKTPLDVAREKRQSAVVAYLQERETGKPSRGLIDGGLGVSEAMDGL